MEYGTVEQYTQHSTLYRVASSSVCGVVCGAWYGPCARVCGPCGGLRVGRERALLCPLTSMLYLLNNATLPTCYMLELMLARA